MPGELHRQSPANAGIRAQNENGWQEIPFQ